MAEPQRKEPEPSGRSNRTVYVSRAVWTRTRGILDEVNESRIADGLPAFSMGQLIDFLLVRWDGVLD
jgi:hypothetical protein